MIPLSSVKFQANKASDFCFLWHSLGMCQLLVLFLLTV